MRFASFAKGLRVSLMANAELAIHAEGAPTEKATSGGTVRMKLVGSTPAPRALALDEQPGRSNYFIGNDPKKWRTNVPTYVRVKYEKVFPGVDLIYYGTPRELEYDFVVAPHADPRIIRVAIDGADKLEVDHVGDLVVHAHAREIRFRKPVIYQSVNGSRREVAGGYVLSRDNQIGFHVAEYDPSLALVIDPVLVYSVRLGTADFAGGIAADPSGNTYVVGSTPTDNFPVTNSLQTARDFDTVFIFKLDPSGNLIYSTYLGGNGGDRGRGIAFDAAGNAYVAGTTSSTNFPTTPGALQTSPRTSFVTKLNATGSALLYSTYFGSTTADEYTNCCFLATLGSTAMAADANGNVYLVGTTQSRNFPTANPVQAAFHGVLDVFVSKLNPSGSALVYSTYLGGASYDEGQAIAVDSAGNAYVTGRTSSSDFPTASPMQPSLGGQPVSPLPGGNSNAFVTKLSAAGSFVYSTYLGGSAGAFGTAIATDLAGNVYVTGNASAGFPTTPNAFQASASSGGTFVAKLNASGSVLSYSTYAGDARPYGLAVDSSGNAYITGGPGFTPRTFPLVNPLQRTCRSGSDCYVPFIQKLDPAGSRLLFSTFFGSGTGDERGRGIALDTAGNVYIVGIAQDPPFPTLGPLHHTSGGLFTRDIFVAKIGPADAPGIAVGPGSMDFLSYLNGFSLAQELTLIAAGGAPLRIDSIVASGDFIRSNECTSVLAAGERCTLRGVSFAPKTLGASSGAITITHNGASSPTTVRLTGTSILPALNSGGVVNGASFVPNQPLAPGSIASVFGTNLAIPLFSLGTQVSFTSATGTFDGYVFYSGTQQINFQVPPQLQGQAQATLTVIKGLGATSNSVTIPLASSAPGIFSRNSQGTGAGAILFAGTNVFASTSRPARSGDIVSIFCTGLGVDPRPPVTVSIGGVTVVPSYVGGAPGFIGLDQVNVTVPAGITPGSAVPVFLVSGTATSNSVTMAVQ